MRQLKNNEKLFLIIIAATVINIIISYSITRKRAGKQFTESFKETSKTKTGDEISEEDKLDRDTLQKQIANINTRQAKYPYPDYGEDTALDVVVHEYYEKKIPYSPNKIYIPINAEFGLPLLDRYYITPVQFFLIRSHSPPPPVANELRDRNQLVLTDQHRRHIVDIKNGVISYQGQIPKPMRKTVTIQCAGNRRKEADSERKVSGTLWRNSSIGNAFWEGYSLKSLLEMVWGKSYQQYKYLVFTAHDATIYPGEQQWDLFINKILGNDVDAIPTDSKGIPCYQVSVGMEKLDDIFLATKMNGLPIPTDHGYPVRGIVPGYIGARSVKWLERVHLSHYPSFGYFNMVDYISYEPKDKTRQFTIGEITKLIINYYTKTSKSSMRTKQAKVDHLRNTIGAIHKKYFQGGTGKSINKFIVQSVITRPIDNHKLLKGENIVRGFAMADDIIKRVHVKITNLADNTSQTTNTDLYQGDPSQKWKNTNKDAWTWWETKANLKAGRYQIESIAYTSKTSQLQTNTNWNVRGVFKNEPFTCQIEVV